MRPARLIVAAATLGIIAGYFAASGGGGPTAVLTSQGIGPAHFGEPKTLVVRQLTHLLGPPVTSVVSAGCGPRYSEVEWGDDLAVEFRLGVFSGYRYLDGGLLRNYTSNAQIESLPVAPRLFVAGGVTLGSTLGEVRSAFGPLRLVGTNRNQSSSGFIFYDDAESFPDPSSSHIIEIKIGTCGDY